MRGLLAVTTCLLLAPPVQAATQVPAGYAPATIYAESPEGRQTMPVYLPRRFCHLRVPALVERNGTLDRAEAGVICTK